MRELIKSVLVLFCICLVVSAILGVTNHFTAPIIDEVNAKASQEACKKVMPDGESFERLEVEGMPAEITGVFRESTGKGFVFEMKVTGYNPGLVIVCGIGNDGLITGTYTVVTNETPTIGGKTQKSEYTDQYVGKDASLSGVDGISGATYTSKAYAKAVKAAFEAYAKVKDGGLQ